LRVARRFRILFRKEEEEMADAEKGYEIHEAATMFPTWSEADFALLVEDMKQNGQRLPIVLYDGKVLEGVHRYRACKVLGLKPKTRVVRDIDPYAYVWSLNGCRRDLPPAVKAAIRLRIEKASGEWQRLAEERKAYADTRRFKVQKGNKTSGRETSPEDCRLAPLPAHDHLAESAGVSRATAERVLKLAKENPEMFEKMAKQEIKPHEALAAVRKPEPKAEPAEPSEAAVRAYLAKHPELLAKLAPAPPVACPKCGHDPGACEGVVADAPAAKAPPVQGAKAKGAGKGKAPFGKKKSRTERHAEKMAAKGGLMLPEVGGDRPYSSGVHNVQLCVMHGGNGNPCRRGYCTCGCHRRARATA